MSKYVCIIRNRKTDALIASPKTNTATEMLSYFVKNPRSDENYVTMMLDGKYYPVDLNQARQNDWQVFDLLSEHEIDERESIELNVHDCLDKYFRNNSVRLTVSLQDRATNLVIDDCKIETYNTYEAHQKALSYHSHAVHNVNVYVVLEADYGARTFYSYGAESVIPILLHLDEQQNCRRNQEFPDLSMIIKTEVDKLLSKSNPVPVALDCMIKPIEVPVPAKSDYPPAMDYRNYYATHELHKIIDSVQNNPELAKVTNDLKSILAAIQK